VMDRLAEMHGGDAGPWPDFEEVEAFTEAQWVTLAGEIPPYPF
jgi:hypothetical protein